MQDQPVQIDRIQVLKDAEAALVAHRVYFSRRLAAIPSGAASIEEVERWRQEWPQQLTSETEVVVDAVIRAITASTVLLTPAEAALAARWLRGRGPRPGETAEEYIAAADSLATRLEAR